MRTQLSIVTLVQTGTVTEPLSRSDRNRSHGKHHPVRVVQFLTYYYSLARFDLGQPNSQIADQLGPVSLMASHSSVTFLDVNLDVLGPV